MAKAGYSPEVKAAALADLASGMTVKEASIKNNVSISSLMVWKRQAKGPSAEAEAKPGRPVGTKKTKAVVESVPANGSSVSLAIKGQDAIITVSLKDILALVSPAALVSALQK